MAASILPDGDVKHYKMDHKYRGQCIVFNHETYEFQLEERESSMIDVQEIWRTFTHLGFNVKVFNDLTLEDITRELTKLSEEDHTEADCICIFVLTHGALNDMICAKNAIYLAESIWKPFTADRCRTLVGKPKLVFFQACRGSQLDNGIKMFHNTKLLETATQGCTTECLEPSSSSQDETEMIKASCEVPNEADFFIAHSTTKGCASWRGWFVATVCDIFLKHAYTKDLLTMMTLAAQKIAVTRKSNNDDPKMCDKKQVPSITTTLLGNVYLTPKTPFAAL